MRLGPVHFHVAALVLPSLLVASGHLVRAHRWWVSAVLASSALLILILQPDAAQSMAFALAASLVLSGRADRRAPRRGVVFLLPLAGALAWLRPDPLDPVVYTEGVFRLAADRGVLWSGAATLSLLLLPLPFFLARLREGSRVGAGLGIYVSITILAPLSGDFPVPVMGYGMSPIIGYLAGVSLFLSTGVPHADMQPAAVVPSGAFSAGRTSE
jgi:hypothetical protein